MILNIEVTKNDIKQGKKGHCSGCPVALAIQRAYQEAYPDSSPTIMVAVGHTSFSILLHQSSKRPIKVAEGNITPKISSWISVFDDGKIVEPFIAQLAYEVIQ